MKYVFIIFMVTVAGFGADREQQERVKDYLNILKACPADSAIPAAVIRQLESFKGTDLEKAVIEGLVREYRFRGNQLITACRVEAHEVIKKSSAENAEKIKAQLSELRELGNISKSNAEKYYRLIKGIMDSFIPAAVKWSEKVNQHRKIFTLLKTAVTRIDPARETVEFSTIEYIAKASVCPLALKNPVIIANNRLLTSIPFQCTAAAYQINLVRIFAGKAPLLVDPKLNVVAFSHAKDMKENNYLSHESPTEGMKTLQDRAAKFKTSAAEEIIGRGTTDVLKLNYAYLKRYKNARQYFGPWTRIGVGFQSKYWTQVFGK